MYKYDIMSYKEIFTLLYMVKKKSIVGMGESNRFQCVLCIRNSVDGYKTSIMTYIKVVYYYCWSMRVARRSHFT